MVLLWRNIDNLSAVGWASMKCEADTYILYTDITDTDTVHIWLMIGFANV